MDIVWGSKKNGWFKLIIKDLGSALITKSVSCRMWLVQIISQKNTWCKFKNKGNYVL